MLESQTTVSMQLDFHDLKREARLQPMCTFSQKSGP
jgi:hypothetical protein